MQIVFVFLINKYNLTSGGAGSSWSEYLYGYKKIGRTMVPKLGFEEVY